MAKTPSAREKLYFHARAAAQREELRAELAAAAKRLHQHEKAAKALGTDDKDLVERIHVLGFRGESARVFDLLPLVHVSWADGQVQRGERAIILELLEGRGIQPGSRPFMLIETLLEERPADAFMEESLSLLKDLVAQKEGATENIIDLCHKVADASGGLLGFGARVSDDERNLMKEVAETLGDTAQSRFKERFGE